MKIHIFDSTEGYPLYQICNMIDEDKCFDIDITTLKRWKKAAEEFVKFQIEVGELVRQSKGGDYEVECWEPMIIDIEEGDSSA